MGCQLGRVKLYGRFFFGPSLIFTPMSTVHFYCVLCGQPLETSTDLDIDLTKCHACSRTVPVPRRVKGSGNFKSYPPVFPPEVLDLLVKFQCTTCDSELYADARCEGRHVVCCTCGEHTPIPQWSTGAIGHRFVNFGAGGPLANGALPLEAPVLSPEEIDFLRGTTSGIPEVAV